MLIKSSAPSYFRRLIMWDRLHLLCSLLARERSRGVGGGGSDVLLGDAFHLYFILLELK